jgi:hypothetical protein
VPRYNGGLFLSEVDRADTTYEAAAARFLDKHKLPDPFLAHALDLLARDEDPKQHKLVPIDFKSLGVRQLGSIYEGLLEFKLRIADEKKAIVREKNRDVYVSFKTPGEKERERAESQGRIVKKGQLYLENDKGERKATGSYYTPDHIVEYIVQNAVGPVVSEKFEAMLRICAVPNNGIASASNRPKPRVRIGKNTIPARRLKTAGTSWSTSCSTSRSSTRLWVQAISWSRPSTTLPTKRSRS